MTDRVLTPERVALIRSCAPFAIAREAESDFAALFASHERLRAERDLLRAALRTYCTCVGDGLAPTTGHDCPQFPCRAGVALRDAAVDAFDKEG